MEFIPVDTLNGRVRGTSSDVGTAPKPIDFSDVFVVGLNGGGGGTGTALLHSIAQTAHGFIVGNLVRYTGSLFAKAQADTAANAEVTGIVSEIVDANNFRLTTGGKVSGLSGLVAGSVYFLSPTTAGLLTTTEPSTPGQISKPLLIADSATSGYFFNWRGMTVPAPITTMTLDPLMIGTDLRLVAMAGGGKLEVRNPGTGLWATADQWTNP